MAIVPIRATFENFLSFKDKQTFEYQQQGVHYIYGIDYDSLASSEWSRDSYNVGVGKSSLAMLMQYAFYGRIQKKVNKDKIINKETGRDLFVEFQFMIADQLYKIERYRRHKTHRSNVYLFEYLPSDEWRNISGIDNEETQEKIEKLIMMDINTFEKSALLTRDDKTQFLELPTLNRGYIFENLSQLQKLKTYYDKAKKNLKPIDDQLENINNKIIEISTIIKRDAKYIKDLKDSYANKKTKLEETIIDLQNRIQEVSNLGMPVEEVIRIIEEHKSIQQLLDTNDIECEALTKTINDCIALKEATATSLQLVRDDLSKMKKRLTSHKPTTCHNCGAIQDEADYNKEHKRIQGIIKDLEKRESEELKKFQKYIDEITDLEVENHRLIYIERQGLAERKVALPKIKQENIEDIEKLQEQLKEKQKELNDLQSPLEINQLKQEIHNYNQQLIDNRSERNRLSTERSMLSFWVDALDFKNEYSIKQYVISKLIPVFNNLLQQNLEVVYNGAMTVVFDNMFNETILYNGQSYEYDELSTGEKTKLNFCINLSIFDLTRITFEGCRTIFLDEIFVNIDPATIQTFISMIKNKYMGNSAVYIISHSEIVKDLLEPQTVIRIEKKENASKIYLE